MKETKSEEEAAVLAVRQAGARLVRQQVLPKILQETKSEEEAVMLAVRQAGARSARQQVLPKILKGTFKIFRYLEN